MIRLECGIKKDIFPFVEMICESDDAHITYISDLGDCYFTNIDCDHETADKIIKLIG